MTLSEFNDELAVVTLTVVEVDAVTVVEDELAVVVHAATIRAAPARVERRIMALPPVIASTVMIGVGLVAVGLDGYIASHATHIPRSYR